MNQFKVIIEFVPLRLLSGFILVLLILLLSACNITNNPQSESLDCQQVGGTWELLLLTDDTQCGGNGKQEKALIDIKQKGCQLQSSNGETGVIKGSDIIWQIKPWPINGGEVSYSKAIANVEGNKVTGSYDWSWSDGSNTCAGATQVTGSISQQGDDPQGQETGHPMLIPSEGTIAHTFSLPAPNASKVFLAGEMSDWQDNVFEMHKDKKGMWTITLHLSEGAWQYKFVVDGQWQYDKNNPNKTDDSYDGFNSVVVLGKQLDVLLDNPNISQGVVLNREMDSKVLASKVPFSVYLPPGYAKNDQKKYPLLILLHGYGSDQLQWVRDGKIDRIMDNLIAAGSIEPFIIVMPYGDKSQYIDKREIHIIDELIPYIREQYRSKAGKHFTAISGVSMGGFGAFYLAHRHQQLFGLSVPLSGYFNLHNYPDFNPEQLIMEPKLHIYCGRDDQTSFVNNELFVDVLKKGGVDFTYTTAEGGHTWRYWNGISVDFLTVISDFFNNEK